MGQEAWGRNNIKSKRCLFIPSPLFALRGPNRTQATSGQGTSLCIIKHLKHTKLNSIEFLRTEMPSDLSNYRKEYSPYGSYPLFQFERSDDISVLKNSTEYSFVFFKCLFDTLRFESCPCTIFIPFILKY